MFREVLITFRQARPHLTTSGESPWRGCSLARGIARAYHGCGSEASFTHSLTRRVRYARLLVLAFSLTGAACAGRMSGAPPGLRPAHVERLYFGRNIGDTAVVSDTAWTSFVRDVLTPAFPEGATVWDASGQWQSPTGVLVRERSFVVELVHLVTPDVEARVQRVMDAYKQRYAQESVLRLVTNVWASF
jgi:hypothetical protein